MRLKSVILLFFFFFVGAPEVRRGAFAASRQEVIFDEVVRRLERSHAEAVRGRPGGVEDRKVLERLQRAAPSFSGPFLALARRAAEEGDFRSAEALFRRALEGVGYIPAVLEAFGDFLASRGRWEEAQALLQTGLAARPGSAVLRFRLASVLEVSNPEKALVLWEGLAREGVAEAGLRAAALELSRGRPHDAVLRLERHRRKRPLERDSLVLHLHALRLVGKEAEADQMLEAVAARTGDCALWAEWAVGGSPRSPAELEWAFSECLSSFASLQGPRANAKSPSAESSEGTEGRLKDCLCGGLWIARAQFLAAAGRNREAEAAWREAWQHSPADPRVQAALFSSGRSPAGILSEERRREAWTEARRELKRGKWRSALRWIRDVPDDPRFPMEWKTLEGIAEAAKGDEEFLRYAAVRAESSNVRGRLLLARALEAGGNRERALAVLLSETGETLDPEFFFRVGRLRLGLGDFGGAAEAFREANLRDRRERYWVDLGLAWLRGGREVDALRAFEEELHQRPASPRAWEEIARIAAAKGNWNRVRDAVLGWITADPLNVAPWSAFCAVAVGTEGKQASAALEVLWEVWEGT